MRFNPFPKIGQLLNETAYYAFGMHVCRFDVGEAKVTAGVAYILRTCELCGKKLSTAIK